MNELLFFGHTFFIMLSILVALALGKEALISLIALMTILSNVFVTKQITLFNFWATPTDPFTIGIVLSFNLLQEYYGKALVKKTITVSIFISLVYLLFTQIHLVYAPTAFDTMHHHARALLGVVPRIIAASLTTYYVVQHFDSVVYGFLKRRYRDYFLLRNYGTVLLSQLIDTILFSFLGLYGIVASIIPIICISYCIKIASIMIATPCVWFAQKIMAVKK